MGFPREEYWPGVPFPPPGDLPNPGIKPMSSLTGDFFTTEPPGKPLKIAICISFYIVGKKWKHAGSYLLSVEININVREIKKKAIAQKYNSNIIELKIFCITFHSTLVLLNKREFTRKKHQFWFISTLWTIAYQAPPFMEFSRQGYWRALPFPSPEDLLNPGIEPRSQFLCGSSKRFQPPVTFYFTNSKWGQAAYVWVLVEILTDLLKVAKIFFTL